MPIKFRKEFKRDAVALMESGIAQKTVCKDLGYRSQHSVRGSKMRGSERME